MSELVIEDFRAGLDRRKSIITAVPGSLQTATNVHISRGGELEKRRAFVPYTSVSNLSAGLSSNSGTLFTFGPDPTAFVTPILQNIQCAHPIPAYTLLSVISCCMFRGRPYMIGLFSDGSVLHFYDGAINMAFYPGGAYASYVATDCCTLGSKIYVTANTSLICSENDAPENWGTNNNGSGIFDLATKYGGAEPLTAVNIYINRLAVYSRYNVQIIVADPDPLKTALLQVLPTLGTVSPRSVTPYGDTDNFILAQTGVRSLRARDMSLTAGIYDIGTPIDSIINPFVRALTPLQITNAQSVVDPVDGRYMLSVGGILWVFSYFPASHISAWTQYNIGGDVAGWGVIGPNVFARVGNEILWFGGSDGLQYDACPVEVVLPYLSAGHPSSNKQLEGIDMAITGRWDVEVGLDPNPPYSREMVARFDHETFGMGRVPAVGEGTHFGVRLTSSTAGPATLGSMIFSYTGGPEDD